MSIPPTHARSPKATKPVPRGAERARALAAAAAEARARLDEAPDPFGSLTPEQRARNRASREPEIAGSGPQRQPR